MNALIPVLLFLLITANVFAQNLLTSAGDFKIGQMMAYHSAQLPPYSVDTTGPDAYWDYSTLLPGDPVSITIESPSMTPYSTLFSGADVVEHFSTGIYQYQTIGMYNDMIGFVDEAQDLRITYPNPWRVAARPLAFDEHLFDTLTRTYSGNGLDFNGIGYSHLHVDGRGILTLPEIGSRNVLRVKIEQINYDTSLAGILTVRFISWRWYEPDGVFPLLRIDSSTITSSFFNTSSTTVIYESTSSLSVPAEQTGNPLPEVYLHEGHLRYNCRIDPSATYTVAIYAINGTSVWKWIGKAGELSAVECPLPVGWYIISIADNASDDKQQRAALLIHR